MRIPMNLDVVRSAVKAVSATDLPGPPAVIGGVVTIARQAGVGAPEIAMKVAERLNSKHPHDTPWLAYDKNLVERVAEESEIEASIVATLDEHDQSTLDQIFDGLVGKPTVHTVAMKMARSIRGLARSGRAIIVGRGGGYILAGVPNALHVRLVAPLDWRVRAYARFNETDEATARARVTELDEERSDYIKATLNRDPEDSSAFDLVINVERLTADHTADIIVRAVEELHLEDE